MREYKCQHCKKSFKSNDKSPKYCSRLCWNVGHIPWNKGKKLGYMPKTAFKKGQTADEKHPMWKGGGWIWAKRKVMDRDGGICLNCGLEEKEIMDVAHIIPVRGDNNRRYGSCSVDNLITLCPNCHRRFDKGLINLEGKLRN